VLKDNIKKIFLKRNNEIFLVIFLKILLKFIICINLEITMNHCLYDIFINFRVAIQMLFFSRTVLTCDNFHGCVRNLYERSL